MKNHLKNKIYFLSKLIKTIYLMNSTIDIPINPLFVEYTNKNGYFRSYLFISALIFGIIALFVYVLLQQNIGFFLVEKFEINAKKFLRITFILILFLIEHFEVFKKDYFIKNKKHYISLQSNTSILIALASFLKFFINLVI
ncbi:hypothetical protein Mgra_00007162 [Meloidogyne graminicola]|uniref:Uncharacterized protein n=1 Tax=Meloidogyne graminicola TaxID=189291 RepID=A0A8S9ZJ77_9BILA|nr:hypothetical protein Mgra_00007162 [Meloidogyne graminicola]